MSHYPDTLEPADNWREHAVCTPKTTDLFFPAGTDARSMARAEEAKAICRTCPVAATCLDWALDTQQDTGIWGGLDEHERRRSHGRRAFGGATAKPPRTPASVLAARSKHLANGHVTWTGATPVSIRGKEYSPAQLAWFVAYGERPEGHLTAHCGQPGCINPEHRLDGPGRAAQHGTRAAYLSHRRRGEPACEPCLAANRAEQDRPANRKTYKPKPTPPAPPVPDCGTRPGYQAHRKRGEEACRPCKDANADADRRLRNTGTTKAKASV